MYIHKLNSKREVSDGKGPNNYNIDLTSTEIKELGEIFDSTKQTMLFLGYIFHH